MSHKARIARLEHAFEEAKGARRLSEILAAAQVGDLEALQVHERIELASGGRHGWMGNMYCAILEPLAGGAPIAPEDLTRPEA